MAFLIKRRRLATYACMLSMVALTVGGVASVAGTAQASKASTAGTVNLTVGDKTVSSIEVVEFVAQAEGLFAQNGVNVNYNINASPATLLVSGQAQLIDDSAIDIPTLIQQGVQAVGLSTLATNIPPGLLGSPGITTIAQLKAMGSSCVLTSNAAGIQAAFTAYWVKKFGLQACQLQYPATVSLGTQGIQAGRYSAGFELAANAVPALNAGSQWIINPSDPNYVKDGDSIPRPYLNTAIYSTSAILKRNSVAIGRYFKTIAQAVPIVKAMSNLQIAQLLQGSSALTSTGIAAFASQTVAAVEAGLFTTGFPTPFQLNGIKYGPISEKTWNATLPDFKLENFIFSVHAPKFSWKEAVNDTLANKYFK